MIGLLTVLGLLFALGIYLQARVELSYRAYKSLGRPPSLPELSVMAFSPRHQLRWTRAQWLRWIETRLVLLG